MRPHGRISFITLLLLAGVGLGIYFLVVIGPVYLDNIDVIDAVREAHSKAVGATQFSDIQIRNYLLETTSRIGSHYELDESGEEVEAHGLGLDEDAIEIERDDHGWVTVRVTYERQVQLVPLKSRRLIQFSPTKTGSRESK